MTHTTSYSFKAKDTDSFDSLCRFIIANRHDAAIYHSAMTAVVSDRTEEIQAYVDAQRLRVTVCPIVVDSTDLAATVNLQECDAATMRVVIDMMFNGAGYKCGGAERKSDEDIINKLRDNLRNERNRTYNMDKQMDRVKTQLKAIGNLLEAIYED